MINTKEQKIIVELKDVGMLRGNEFYIPLRFTSNFLECSRKQELAIIGIEGFIYNGKDDTIEAKLDYIADYSNVPADDWSEYIRRCYVQAEKFLSSLPRDKNIWVNFVLLDHDEWKSPKKLEIDKNGNLVRQERGC